MEYILRLQNAVERRQRLHVGISVASFHSIVSETAWFAQVAAQTVPWLCVDEKEFFATSKGRISSNQIKFSISENLIYLSLWMNKT